MVCEVYPAGEEPIRGAASKDICQAIRVRGSANPIYVPSIEEMASVLEPIIENGDVILTLGAGSIGKECRTLFQSYAVAEIGQAGGDND